MAELMGICGADSRTTQRIVDRMRRHVAPTAPPVVDTWCADGLGLLSFRHAAVNPRPQPVANADASLLLAMDGEVFPAEPDAPDAGAAYVLRLYEQHGEAAFRKLTGSFSVAVYRPADGRLMLVTDPFFSRPVYHCRMGQALVFSSRFNALVACGALDGGRLDMTAVMQLFTFQHCQYRSTLYREARAMLPASVLTFEHGRVTTRKYWRLSYEPDPGDEGEFAERLADGIRRSVAARTRGDARLGVLLSGGLDARTLVAASSAPMRAYTVADYANREVRIARRVARAKGWPHVFLPRPDGHHLRTMDEAIELAGGMGRFDNAHFLNQLKRPARQCDAFFVEELMDALFKGVYWQQRKPVRGLRVPWPGHRRHSWRGIEEQILRIDCKSTYPSAPWRLFREPWRSRWREIMYATIREQLADADASNPYDAVAHVGGLVSLGRVAAFMNVTCLRPYAEYRSLCLDSALLDLATRMPVKYRMGGRVFVQALKLLDPRLWAIPYANTGMRVDAPEAIAWVARLALELPVQVRKRLGLMPRTHTNESWPDRGELLRTPGFREVLDDTVSDPACLPADVFDRHRLLRLIREHVTGHRRHVRALLSLITFGRWFREYGPSNL